MRQSKIAAVAILGLLLASLTGCGALKWALGISEPPISHEAPVTIEGTTGGEVTVSAPQHALDPESRKLEETRIHAARRQEALRGMGSVGVMAGLLMLFAADNILTGPKQAIGQIIGVALIVLSLVLPGILAVVFL